MALIDPTTGLPVYQPPAAARPFVGQYGAASALPATLPRAAQFIPPVGTDVNAYAMGAPQPAAPAFPTLGVTASGPAAFGSSVIPSVVPPVTPQAVVPPTPPVTPTVTPPAAAAVNTAALPPGSAPLPSNVVLPPLPPGMRVSGAAGGGAQITPAAGPEIIRGGQSNLVDNAPSGVEIIRGDQVTPATASLSAANGQTGVVGSLPGLATGNLNNPIAGAAAGFDRQDATTQRLLGQALDYVNGGGNIFERATRGRAIAGILHAVAGPNNAGGVYGAGVDSLNTGLASEANAATTAAQSGANVGATTDAERDIAASRLEQERQLAELTPRASGTAIGRDPLTGLGVPLPTYSFVRPDANGNPVATPINATPPTTQKAAPIVGATYTDANGNRAVLQADGTYKPVGK